MRRSSWWMLLLLISVTATQTLAQQGCPVLVRQALQAMGDNCSELGRNVVCYGNDEVRASFTAEVEEGFFSQPADIAALNTISTVTTTSLSLEENVWGVAVLNVQANVPESLPGQAVTFVLLGDSEIENAATPEQEPAPRISIPVFTNVNANIRSGPSTNFNRLDVARAGSELTADALSEDGQWVRIVFRDNVGWIFRDTLSSDPVINELRPVDATARTAMQAFFLRTGIGEPTCTEAPQQALLVQGPKNFEVNLTVNGARVNIGSSVLFRTLGEDQDLLEISVLDGQAEVLPEIEGAQPLIIREGFRSVFCLGDPDSRGTDGEANDKVVTCNGTPPERLPREEVAGTLCTLQDLPGDLLRYEIDLVCPGDPVPVQQPVQPQATRSPNQPTPVPGVAGPTAVPGSCNVVSVVGPYGPVQPYGQSFIWNGVEGADRYEMRLTDVNGGGLGSFNTGGNTGITIDPITATNNQTFYFEVLAFSGDRVLCTSGRIGGLPIVSANLDAAVMCTGLMYYINWSNAGPSDIISYEVPGDIPQTTIGSGSSGSATVPAECFADVIVRSSNGASKFFSAVDCGC